MKTIKYFLFSAILLIASSCTKDFEEYNKNPLKPTSISPDLLLTGSQISMTGNLHVNWHNNLNILEPMVQHISGEWGVYQGGRYSKEVYDYWVDFWHYAWPNEVKNIVQLVEITKGKPEFQNINAIGRIMKVLIFSRLTDLYGDIPYFDAGKAYNGDILNPRYDTQESIYNDFFSELQSAITALDDSKDRVKYDLFYNGDISKWKKFAASLRLRLAMRLSKVNPTLAREQVIAAVENGLMTSNDDICMLKHMDVPVEDLRGNPNSEVFNFGPGSAEFRICNTLVDHFKATNDPRLEFYTAAYDFEESDITTYTGYKGLRPGEWAWDVYEHTSTLTITDGDGNVIHEFDPYIQFLQPKHEIASMDAPTFYLTYAEVQLYLAEARYRNWITTQSAAEYYANGVEAGLQMLSNYPKATPIDETEIHDYVTNNPLQVGQELKMINEELWVNYFLNGFDAYANWRRSGYPVLAPVNWNETQTGGVTPRRYFYPDDEMIKNGANLQVAIDRLGGSNDWLARVWWDKE